MSNSGHKSEEKCWQLWFDGAALPNPGRIGIGVLLVSPTGERFERACLPGAAGCSNEAELRALIYGLELARSCGASTLQVFGDSDFAIRAAQESAAHRVTEISRLRELIEPLQQLLAEYRLICEEGAISVRWVPRHRNSEADRLSRRAFGLPDRSLKPSGLLKSGKKKRRSGR